MVEHGDSWLVLCEGYLHSPEVTSFTEPLPAFAAAKPVGPSTIPVGTALEAKKAGMRDFEKKSD
jgi:hypothetical protein